MSAVLDPTTISKIAHLARLSTNLSQEELERYTRQLSAILNYAEELQEVDTTGIAPTDGFRTITIEDLRSDEPFGDWEEYQRVRVNIINNFPNKQGNLLVLANIFEE